MESFYHEQGLSYELLWLAMSSSSPATMAPTHLPSEAQLVEPGKKLATCLWHIVKQSNYHP